MIIRVTVGDSDFGDFMSVYLKHFLQRVLCCDFDKDISLLSREEMINNIKKHKKIRDLFDVNNSNKLTNEDKEFIVDLVKKDFYHYVDEYSMTGMNIDVKTSNNLKSNFKVNVLESFTDRNEHNKVYYWLQHSNKVICQ